LPAAFHSARVTPPIPGSPASWTPLAFRSDQTKSPMVAGGSGCTPKLTRAGWPALFEADVSWTCRRVARRDGGVQAVAAGSHLAKSIPAVDADRLSRGDLAAVLRQAQPDTRQAGLFALCLEPSAFVSRKT
jgi:hypothetical protein